MHSQKRNKTQKFKKKKEKQIKIHKNNNKKKANKIFSPVICYLSIQFQLLFIINKLVCVCMRRLYVKNERERGGEKEDETERGVRK